MNLAHRPDRLECALQAGGGPTRDEYEGAVRRTGMRNWLWTATIVKGVGIPIPFHCLPMIQEAIEKLAGHTEYQRTQDKATVETVSRGHGYPAGVRRSGELHQKLTDMAGRHPTGERPQTMAEALALAVYGHREADSEQC